jgi:hypothetical protein
VSERPCLVFVPGTRCATGWRQSAATGSYQGTSRRP